jgi:hypothetical protein
VRRALACAGAVVAVLLAAAVPARAASPTVEFTTPTDGQRLGEATFRFIATVRMPSGGTVRGNITVTWSSPDGRSVPGPTTVAAGNANSQRVEIPDRTFSFNGRYRVDVTATGRDGTFDTNGDENGGGRADFVVDAAPAKPAGLGTGVRDDRTVAVTWQANREPDMVGYKVERQLGSAPWEQVAVTDRSTTSVVDSATSERGGTYRYRVLAFRTSADSGKLNPSLPSDTSTADVPRPPVTTTTTSPPGPDGEEEATGGSRSGTSSGTGTGSTGSRPGSGAGAGSSAGSAGGAGGSTTSATLPSTGKVDLSGFAALLAQSRESGQSPSALAGEEDEGGFDETLPFSGRARDGAGDGDGSNDVAILEEGGADEGSDRLQSLAFLAGGLLATVLVMHLLWVRSELRRVEVLEAVTPEPPPARSPRRRRFVAAAEPDEAAEEREPVTVG